MSFVPFFVIAVGASIGALLTRRSSRVSLALGLGGLAGAFLAALTIQPGEMLVIGGDALVTTAYQRLFLVLGTASGLLICVVGLATAWQRNVPAALLASLGWTGLALALPDPTVAVLATIGGGLAGILVTLVTPIDDRGVQVGARELRAVAVAGALALAATTWVVRAAGPAGAAAAPIGLAYLAMVVALALRFGVIPFHAWAGRLSQSASETALPLLLAWAPAGLGVVALAWVESSVAPLAQPLGIERGVVVAIGALSLVLGTFAAWIQDDVEHVVGYSMAQDAGFIILALAVLDTAPWEPARTWILIFVLAKTALASWALTLHATYGTRRIDDLTGWARRSPVLGLAFVLIALATIGWPGSAAWAARVDLIRLAVSDPLGTLIFLGALSSLAYYARLAGIGLREPSSAVLDRAALRLRWPRSLMRAEDDRAGATGVAGDALAEAQPLPTIPDRDRMARGRDLVGQLGSAWRVNRAPTATAVVLGLSLVALVAAAGGLGIPEAARGGPPEPAAVVSPLTVAGRPPVVGPPPVASPAP